MEKKKKTIFVTGGARSGKSRFAVDAARSEGGVVAYIATCRPGDAEMRRRVRLHRAERPKEWITVEEEISVAAAVAALPKNVRVVLIDCVTLLVTNMMLAGWTDKRIEKAIVELARVLAERPGVHIIVSNEVGAGIVPENALARRFRDVVGRANALLAASADEVYVLFCGIPLRIKPESGEK